MNELIPDYETAARRAGWTPSRRRPGYYVDADGNMEQASSWREVCELDGIDPLDTDDYVVTR